MQVGMSTFAGHWWCIRPAGTDSGDPALRFCTTAPGTISYPASADAAPAPPPAGAYELALSSTGLDLARRRGGAAADAWTEMTAARAPAPAGGAPAVL